MASAPARRQAVETLGTATEENGVTARVRVTNTGPRAGKHVVQIYLSRLVSTVDRSIRWLAGLEVVRLGPGETTQLELPVPRRAFAHWGAMDGSTSLLHVGSSATDLVAGMPVELGEN